MEIKKMIDRSRNIFKKKEQGVIGQRLSEKK
jgi:hypothetical protein